jgi:hypothetical protein
MTVRHVCGALPAIMLTGTLANVVPAYAQTWDPGLLPPEQSGLITVSGCLLRGGTNGDKYVLASPRSGAVDALPGDTCNVAVDEGALELEHARRHDINESMLGRWIEVSGRLEKETNSDPGNLRELYVHSFRVAGIAPAQAWTRDASLLPPGESGVITIAGCLQGGGKNGAYVLASPRLGPVPNAPEDTCRATIDDRALALLHEGKQGMNDSMIGRWVEVNGRLEKETSNDPNNLREVHVRSFRMVPVVPPRIAAARIPESPFRFEQQPVAPAADPIVPSEEQAVGTTGTVQTAILPQTASPLYTIGLLGLLSLTGASILRLRRYHGRG